MQDHDALPDKDHLVQHPLDVGDQVGGEQDTGLLAVIGQYSAQDVVPSRRVHPGDGLIQHIELEMCIRDSSCTVTVTGADVDVLPSTEPTETEDQLPDGLNDEVKEAVNEAAGTVNADSALSQAAQEQAGQLADSAEKDELLQKGQSELGSEEIVPVSYTHLDVYKRQTDE